MKSFCIAEETVGQVKKSSAEWERIFADGVSARGVITRIYKELKKQRIKNPNVPSQNWELNREFSEDEENIG